MLAIELNEVGKAFRSVVALDQLTMQVQPDEIVALVGPSGAGKTTALRVIAGLEKPDSGSIQIAGEDATQRPPAHRDVAYLTQDYALYPHLTVRQNLQAAIKGRSRARRLVASEQQRVDDILERLRVASVAERRPAAISGGQAQRVALAKAIVRQPKILLLDEPLSQLDTQLRHQTRELLLELKREETTAFVIVCHDPLDTLQLADRIAVLDAGRVTQIGSAESVYNQPRSAVAAEVLSPFGINRITLDGNEHSFRPEDAELVLDSSGKPEHCLDIDQLEVIEVRSLGFTRLAVLSIRSRDSKSHYMKCFVNDDRALALGDRVRLQIPRKKMLNFIDG